MLLGAIKDKLPVQLGRDPDDARSTACRAASSRRASQPSSTNTQAELAALIVEYGASARVCAPAWGAGPEGVGGDPVGWKGLRVYHDGTSTLLYPSMSFVVESHYPKTRHWRGCRLPPVPKGAV